MLETCFLSMLVSNSFRIPPELCGCTQTSLEFSTAVTTKSHSFSEGFPMLGMVLVLAEPDISGPRAATFSLGLE